MSGNDHGSGSINGGNRSLSTRHSREPAVISGSDSSWLLSEAERVYRVCASLHSAGAQRGVQFAKANRKLARVRDELTQQIAAVARLLAQIKDTYEGIAREATSMEDGAKTLEELDNVLQRLRIRQLHEVLRSSSAAPEQTQCLFDYVDTEAIDALRRQAIQEMQVLGKIREVASSHVTTMQNKFQELKHYGSSHSRDKSHVESTGILSDVRLYIDRQEKAFQRVTKLYYSIRSGVSGNDSLSTSRDTGLRRPSMTREQLQNLRTVLSSIRSIQDELTVLTKKIEDSAAEHSAMYRESVQVFSAIEQLGPEMRTRLKELHSLATKHSEAVKTASNAFEEFRNLTAWYRQFDLAYKALIREIIRRRKQLKLQQELVEKFKRELGAMLERETEAREAFFEAHGRYLPSSICPAIDEPVATCRIIPNVFETDLPELSEDAVEWEGPQDLP